MTTSFLDWSELVAVIEANRPNHGLVAQTRTSRAHQRRQVNLGRTLPDISIKKPHGAEVTVDAGAQLAGEGQVVLPPMGRPDSLKGLTS